MQSSPAYSPCEPAFGSSETPGRPVISASHSAYLAAGGLGLTVGDGALTYAPEYVAEAYYSMRLTKGVFVTADYQFLGNPAYNAVRGPAHFFSGRLMAKF